MSWTIDEELSNSWERLPTQSGSLGRIVDLLGEILVVVHEKHPDRTEALETLRNEVELVNALCLDSALTAQGFVDELNDLRQRIDGVIGDSLR